MSQRRPSWWAELTGASDRELIAGLRRQLAVARDAADVAEQLVGGRLPSDEARAEAARIEQAGDDARDDVFALLSNLLTTPVDREDLYRLSRALEDVIDNLRDFVREADLLGIGADELLAPVVAATAAALERLRGPLEDIGDDLPAAGRAAIEGHREINEVRRTYQQGLARLYEGELEMATLKRRDLLRRLDIIGLRLGEAVGALSDGAMKRGR
jgi:uncharacterized protein Yka (UPF0111/DUF47 family)